MVVGWADLVAGAAEVIAKLTLNVRLDFCLAAASTSQEDGRCGGFCALNALRVIVGYFRRKPRHTAHSFQVIV